MADKKLRGTNDKHKGRYQYKESSNSNKYLLPLIIMIAILPLVVGIRDFRSNLNQFSWYPTVETEIDFFLLSKQTLLLLTFLLMLLITLYKVINKKSEFIIDASFVPLALYLFLAILSTIFSKNIWYALHGSKDHFESIFVIIAYCFVSFYAVQCISNEHHVRNILQWLSYSAITLGILGFTQLIGKDFIVSDVGKKLVTIGSNISDINLAFGEGRVYLTLFNPNYVGVYVALVIPIILVLLIFSKEMKQRVIYAISLIGLIICEFGSLSLTGFIALALTLLVLILFLRKYILKYWKVTAIIIVIATAIVVLIGKATNMILFDRIKNVTKVEKTEYNLKGIVTNDDNIEVNYKENKLYIALDIDQGLLDFVITDQDGNRVLSEFDETTNIFKVVDDRFPGFVVSPVLYEEYLCISIMIENKQWLFTNQTDDGSYYLINRYGKLDKIITPPSALFSDYEKFASNRGYIWSRSIPMLKDNLLLGSGPDTYAIEYPQQDYIGLFNNGMETNILTKPHSLYLQMAIQTGLLSLIAFLVFYGMYFITSIRLYFNGKFDTYYRQAGLGVFCGTIGYMVAGLANDSTLVTAPIFWSLMGVGIAINRKVKEITVNEEVIK